MEVANWIVGVEDMVGKVDASCLWRRETRNAVSVVRYASLARDVQARTGRVRRSTLQMHGIVMKHVIEGRCKESFSQYAINARMTSNPHPKIQTLLKTEACQVAHEAAVVEVVGC